jgi:allophanate hydrolase
VARILRRRVSLRDPDPLEFYGDAQAKTAFANAVGSLHELGGMVSKVDFSLFLETAALLYDGPWVAERMAAIRPFFEAHADQIHPVVREIIGGATQLLATDLFQATTRLHVLRKEAARVWDSSMCWWCPPAPTAYKIDEVLADPFQTNRRLGHYTNFVNLRPRRYRRARLFRPDGLPVGITLIGPAGSDRMLADLAQRFHQHTGLRLGALDEPLPPPAPIVPGKDSVKVAVVGAHLSGLPLNHELTQRGARLERAARTATQYRLFALPGTTPPKPGMVRENSGAGQAIELEVWCMSAAAFGAFVTGIPSPLGIGRIELEDGEWVQVVCESWALAGAEDISRFGGWRAFLGSRTRP